MDEDSGCTSVVRAYGRVGYELLLLDSDEGAMFALKPADDDDKTSK